MPGDSLTETVEVKHNGAEKVPVKLYLRATGAESGSEEFLSQLSLSVRQGDGALFEATADQTGGLADWVLLGTFAYGESDTLELTLTVPIEMGNAYQDAAGLLDWQFKVEEVDETPGDDPDGGDTPDDGDPPGGSKKTTPGASRRTSGGTSKKTPITSRTTGKTTAVQTGDRSHLVVYAVLSGVMLAALIFLERKRKGD